MAKREFLQLAHNIKSKDNIGGWWYSEKLDGHRVFWDGGISNGIPKIQVPWANNDKDERYLDQQIATGLWSRYGNVYHAPDWWIETLPPCPLDGELYNPDLDRQDIASIIKNQSSDNNHWEDIRLYAFDLPPYEKVFADGLIDNINFKKRFKDIMLWVMNHVSEDTYIPPATLRYESAYHMLGVFLEGVEHPRYDSWVSRAAIRHKQFVLPMSYKLAHEKIDYELQKLDDRGGEGLIVRDPNSQYMCERSHKILKVKTWNDAEGTVIGYITGRATDKGSKLLGKMGAMILTLDNGKRLELSGFTDEERELSGYNPELVSGKEDWAEDWATRNPETECPDWITCLLFPRGTRVSFRYRGLTKDGIPNEARYWRKDDRI